MDAVQRMRKKAQDKGTLKTTEQQTVETRIVEKKQVVVIEPSSPDVIYVPSYDPLVVWGPAYYYPYPPIYYPPAGYYAAGLALSFGFGVMMGAFWSGGWGWGCGWGNNDININNNNNFNRNTNIGGGRNNIGSGNRPSQLPSRGGGNLGAGNRPSQLPSGGGNLGAGNRPSTLPASDRWQHNPAHRGGAPYRDRETANRFGGTTRGDSLTNRQAGARQQLGRQGGNVANRAGTGGFNNRIGSSGIGNRSDGGTSLGNRSGGGGPDRIGSRDLSRSDGGNRDAFGGGTRGYDGSRARSSSSRGASSLGSRGGGGGSSGGGRRGGGGRRR
jgi:hypothetical protein